MPRPRLPFLSSFQRPSLESRCILRLCFTSHYTCPTLVFPGDFLLVPQPDRPPSFCSAQLISVWEGGSRGLATPLPSPPLPGLPSLSCVISISISLPIHHLNNSTKPVCRADFALAAIRATRNPPVTDRRTDGPFPISSPLRSLARCLTSSHITGQQPARADLSTGCYVVGSLVFCDCRAALEQGGMVYWLVAESMFQICGGTTIDVKD